MRSDGSNRRKKNTECGYRPWDRGKWRRKFLRLGQRCEPLAWECDVDSAVVSIGHSCALKVILSEQSAYLRKCRVFRWEAQREGIVWHGQSKTSARLCFDCEEVHVKTFL